MLCQEGNPAHRVRVEHDNHTVLVHISGEDGGSWTTLALDRETRGWSIAQRQRQVSAASATHTVLYD